MSVLRGDNTVMKVCLAAFGTNEGCFDHKNLIMPKYVLESFIYYKDWEECFIKECDLFILDSGVFTFLTSQRNKKMDWYKYADDYSAFVRKHGIKNYIELDIYSIIGIKETEKIRDYIEKKVGYKSIPVFHKLLGKDYLVKLCSQYDYIALGGFVNKEITKDEYKYVPEIINIAHKSGARIHGLGFTNTRMLHKYHFDTVDSSSWTSGWRFGQLHMFSNGMIKTKSYKSKRVINGKGITDFNIKEWEKFQDYAETHL